MNFVKDFFGEIDQAIKGGAELVDKAIHSLAEIPGGFADALSVKDSGDDKDNESKN